MRGYACNEQSKQCKLSLEEEIITVNLSNPKSLLNEKPELVSKCYLEASLLYLLRECLIFGIERVEVEIRATLKRKFFQTVTVSVLLHRCTTWNLTKFTEEKLDKNYARMIFGIERVEVEIRATLKRKFFQTVTVSVLLHRCTTWNLTKFTEEKLDKNYARMIPVVWKKI